jgi:hypothetical protein
MHCLHVFVGQHFLSFPYNFVKSHMEGASIATSAQSLNESILESTKATGSCSINLLFRNRSSSEYHSKESLGNNNGVVACEGKSACRNLVTCKRRLTCL